MKKIDLHLHTVFSDGNESPQQVVALAQQAGLAALSITDHDTVEGLAAGCEAAEAAGMECVSGIELSAVHEDIEVHILGYLFDPRNDALNVFLEDQKRRRKDRLKKILRLLADEGLRLDAEAILESAGPGTVGRPHVARALVTAGYVSSFREAFDVYLGKGKPGYVACERVTPQDAIGLIREAGGVAAVAHPVFLGDDALIERFCAMGLGGVEVFHPAHSKTQQQHYRQIAERLDLVCTGGSDYHGEGGNEGSQVGAGPVVYSVLESLRDACARQN